MDTLHSALGKFYFTEHTNAPPTFLQVIGWTKGAERSEATRRYVYVRKVPLTHQYGPNGGQWRFDMNIIRQYATEPSINTPIHKHLPGITDAAIIIDGAHFLRYQSITVPLKIFE